MKEAQSPHPISMEEIALAKGRYQIMLNHYRISRKVQNVVWEKMLEGFSLRPAETCQEVGEYWEEYDGSGKESVSGNKSGRQNQIEEKGNTGLTAAEESLYLNRRQGVREWGLSKKAGSRRKANGR